MLCKDRRIIGCVFKYPYDNVILGDLSSCFQEYSTRSYINRESVSVTP